MSRTLKMFLIASVVVVVAAGAGLWWFFKDDAPAEVSLDAAAEQVLADSEDTVTNSSEPESDAGSVADADIDSDAAAAATSDAGASADASGIEGTWTVDTTTGDFDYESASGSFVGFRIEEELNGIGATTAVGRTGDVTGTISIEATTVSAASFDIDLTTITTDDSRRDDNVQDALEIDAFPTASFVLTAPIELPDGAADGEAISATATGELTIHGVTQVVDMAIEAQLVADTVVVVGSMEITFADYGVEVPSSNIIISVDDFGILELQLLFTQ